MKQYYKGIVQLSFVLLFVLSLGSMLAQADDEPRLRIVHAAPGLSNIDVYVNDILFFDNVYYRYISDYVPLNLPLDANSAERNIKFLPAGTNLGFPTLIEDVQNYERNRDYTIITAGKFENIQRWRLEDDKNLPGTGSSKVRIVHASLNTPSTEFCLSDACKILAFKENTGYFLINPGTYSPVIRLNGTDITYIDIPPLVLQDNAVHTVFLTGQLEGQPNLQLLYSFDAGDLSGISPPPANAPGNGSYGNQAPIYPPVSGAFLPRSIVVMLVAMVMTVVGGTALWLTRRRSPLSSDDNY